MRECVRKEKGKLIIPINDTFPMQGRDFDIPEQAKKDGVIWNIGKWRRRHDCYGAIYAVIHEKSGMAYIGQSVNNIRDRVASHFSDAFNKKKTIYNTRFSEAIRRFGIESFSVWELSRHYSQEDLDRAEIDAIKKYRTNLSCGFNSESGGKRNYVYSQVTVEKMSASRMGPKNPRYGKEVSAKTRKLIGDATRGEKSAWYGKKHTKEELRKISESNRKYYSEHPERAAAIAARRRRKIICLDTGKIYDSMTDAAIEHKTTVAKLCCVCKGKSKTVSGKRFSYYNEGEKQK